MSSAANERNKLVKIVDGKRKVESAEEALWVLKKVSECQDFDMQAKLLSAEGKNLLKNLLTTVELQEVNTVSVLMSFMETFMNNPSGISKNVGETVLETMYRTPMFLEELRKLQTKGKIDKPQEAILAWFIVQAHKRVALSGEEADTSINGPLLEIVKGLLMSQPEVFSELKTLFFTQLHEVAGNQYDLPSEPTARTPAATPAPKTYQELKDLVPQHNNDFPLDFRKIAIFPTVEELNAKINQFRVLSIVESSSSSCTEPALMLDRHFRLLREDMLAPLREELTTLLDPKPDNKNRNKTTKFERPIAIGVGTEKISGKPYVNLRFEMPARLRDRVRDMKSKREMQTFFESEAGKKVFPVDSILIFVANNKVVHIGCVVQRDSSLMAHDPKLYHKPKDHQNPDGKQQPPAQPTDAPPPPTMQIGVSFFGDELTSILTSLCQPNRPRKLSDFMVQARSSFFSYFPVLKCLQGSLYIYIALFTIADLYHCRNDHDSVQGGTTGCSSS